MVHSSAHVTRLSCKPVWRADACVIHLVLFDNGFKLRLETVFWDEIFTWIPLSVMRSSASSKCNTAWKESPTSLHQSTQRDYTCLLPTSFTQFLQLSSFYINNIWISFKRKMTTHACLLLSLFNAAAHTPDDGGFIQACCMQCTTCVVLGQRLVTLQLALTWPLYPICWLTAGSVGYVAPHKKGRQKCCLTDAQCNTAQFMCTSARSQQQLCKQGR